MEIIEGIYGVLKKEHRPLSINNIAKKTGIHNTTVGKYVKLIKLVEKEPTLDIIDTTHSTILRVKPEEGGLLSLPEEDLIELGREYFPEPDKETEFLMDLYRKGATLPTNAFRMRKTELVRGLLKAGHIAKKGERIYLTEIGRNIAKGAIKMYSG